jgi:ethanolamine utilization protein EutA
VRDAAGTFAVSTSHGGEALTPYHLDEVRLLTVGIDIGSATTQVLFSALLLRRRPGALSSTFAVVERTIRYASPVHLTPYISGLRIDGDQLRDFVLRAFSAAGVERSQLDVGAIVVTGEAARRVNAKVVADAVAATAGDFVCIVAGHHLEAVLAAHGSGAVEASRRAGSRMLNIDIGGGTTKFAVVEAGHIVQTAAIHVGGRLAAFDGTGRLTRCEPVCREIAAGAGVTWDVGAEARPADVKRVAAVMADAVVFAACGDALRADDGSTVWLTAPISAGEYDAVAFSGGVAVFIDGSGPSGVDDLGRALGAAVRTRFVRLPGPVVPSNQHIHSTVIGASQYAVQLSGNTVFVSDPGALPIRGLRAVRVIVPGDERLDAGDVAARLARSARESAFEADELFAAMIEWRGLPTFRRLDEFVRGLTVMFAGHVARGEPVCLIFDADIARTAGRMLSRLPGFEHARIVAVDGLDLTAFDYIDIGRIGQSGAVPVTIKSLIFG